MNKTICTLLVAGLLPAAGPARAAVILNDTWADGSRREQNPPAESRWFAANRFTNFLASAGSLRFFTAPASSRAGVTYFTAPGSPITLADGQALVATMVFTPAGTVATNGSRGMRFGLFDFSRGWRLTSDGASSAMDAVDVTGYALFLNHAGTFGAEPLELLERTVTSNSDLLGALAAYTTFGSGGGEAGDPGFVDGVRYTLTLTLARKGANLNITANISGGGLNITHSATDASPTFAFDAFAIRNSRGDRTASIYDISNFKVELRPAP